jgi:23S rRNA (uracil-5-)-methyltransferase RumA
MSLCPNKSICGSCEWSETPYETQLLQKLAGIKRHFSVNDVDISDLEIIPSPKTAHYRNRMDLAIDFQGNFGLRQKGKWWKVIDGHICFIADEKIEELYAICRDLVKTCGLSYQDRRTHSGLLTYMVLRATQKGETLLNVVTSKVALDEEEKVLLALKDLASKTKVTTLLWTQNSSMADVSYGETTRTISGEGFIHEEINGIMYRIYPNSFFQTNSSAASVLQKQVLDFAEIAFSSQNDKEPQKIVDLYCGAGFFTLALKKAFPDAHISGIEEVVDAITGANTNAQLNNMEIEFTQAKSEDISLKQLQPNLVIVDPPRVGMYPKMILNLLDTAPNNIIYVSCRYENFVKDYNFLQKKYSIQKCVAVDMFPHTHHVELVSLLSKWK